MSPSSNDEQFKFLIACIRHANTGKVDFAEVAKECGIVSKGAAAKRYERLMKAHGIPPAGASLRAPTTPSTSKVTTPSTSKKRKLGSIPHEPREAMDDDERPTGVKAEVAGGLEDPFVIKSEGSAMAWNGTGSMPFPFNDHEAQPGTSGPTATPYLEYHPTPRPGYMDYGFGDVAGSGFGQTAGDERADQTDLSKTGDGPEDSILIPE
ncbi:MAG: hypothetical protein M1838_000015 [Thelocarpon superellum]|nr:MAG: hypothetical protein M1838_000015 [Thelocarpon superellum]